MGSTSLMVMAATNIGPPTYKARQTLSRSGQTPSRSSFFFSKDPVWPVLRVWLVDELAALAMDVVLQVFREFAEWWCCFPHAIVCPVQSLVDRVASTLDRV